MTMKTRPPLADQRSMLSSTKRKPTRFRNLLFAGVVLLFMYILIVSYGHLRQYRALEAKLQHTYEQPIMASMQDAEHLYKLFGETDMVFRMFTLEFDNNSYFLYRKHLDSISTFIDSLTYGLTEGESPSMDVQGGFELRNRYAGEFAALRKALDGLILANDPETNPISTPAASRLGSVEPAETSSHQQVQKEEVAVVQDTVVRKRASLFRRIFQAKDDTIIVSNEHRNQIESERLEIVQAAGLTPAGNSLPSSMQHLRSTFRQLQEKEKQLILTNFELLDELKFSIEHMRDLELAKIRESEAADFQSYHANSLGFQRQLIVAIIFLILLIALLYYYQKEVNRWQKQLKEEVIYSNTLADEKTNILDHVTHEIRTPLAALINITELVEKRDNSLSENERNKLIGTAAYQIRGINETITDILSINKLEGERGSSPSFTNEYFRPADIIEKKVNMHSGQADLKNIRISIENNIDPQLQLCGNSFIIGQILSNFIGNAIKYTEQGKPIRVISSLTGTKGKQALHIEVEDKGMGISEEDQKLIFKKYYTGHPTKGFGLGLHLAEALATKLGGQVGVKSTLGQGSIFHLTMPVPKVKKEAVPAEPERSSVEENVRIPAGLKCLIVDDNPINLLFMKKILQKHQIMVFEANDVHRALQIISSEPIPLVITDIHLPDGSGWDILRHIRDTDTLAQLSVYSTTASLNDTLSDGRYHFDGRLGKPFTENDLLGLLGNHLSKKPHQQA